MHRWVIEQTFPVIALICLATEKIGIAFRVVLPCDPSRSQDAPNQQRQPERDVEQYPERRELEYRENEIELWDRYLSETRYVGEVGLDAGPRFFKSLDAQKRVFQHVLQRCAEAGGKIITTHSIRSAKPVLDLVEAHLPPERGKIVLHWFTGTQSEAKRALELGCYFSINAGMLDKERHAAMVQTIPLDRILTETDGPFTRTGERPSQPVDVAIVVEALGRLRGMQAAEMADVIRGNLRALLA